VKEAILNALLRVHSRAETTPYYHLDGYMHRTWVLGYRSPERNGDNPVWKAGFNPKSSALYRWLCRNVAIRAHTILRSDSDRHLHDHPGWSLSIVLQGGYWEVLEPNMEYAYGSIYAQVLELIANDAPVTREEWWQYMAQRYNVFWRGPGAVVIRRANCFHRLILPSGSITKSIFAMGKKSNSWGFLTPQGKVYWRTYLGLDKEQA
jgi:hypothetical protein